MLMKKYVVVRKIEKVVVVSGSRVLQETAAGLTALSALRCDVGLTLRHRRRRGEHLYS